MTRLRGSQIRQIHEAILDAYQEDELEILVRTELDEVWSEIAAGDSYKARVFNFVTWADRQDYVPQLIAAVCAENPGNDALRKLAQDSQSWFAATSVTAGPGSSVTFEAEADPLTQPARLEASLFDVAPIPYAAERLVGRGELLEEIESALAARTRVLLAGLGGIGKTALAAAVAERHLAARNGSVVWLNCRSEEAAAQFEAIERLLVRCGYESAPHNFTGLALDAQLAVARDAYALLPATLLVLDDARNGRALYAVLEAVPEHIAVLVTSRRRFALDRIIDVGTLLPIEALGLLALHAGVRRFGDDVGAEALCRRLGYHPYALEIAGKTLQVDALTPDGLMERVAFAPHAISMPEEFADEHRSSIQALLDESYQTLDAKAQAVLQCYGTLFAPGASAELMAVCSGIALDEVNQALIALQRRSLARRVGTAAYFTIHDLTYSYVAGFAPKSASQIQELVDKIEQYVSAHAHDFDLLDLDQANILTAAENADDARLVRIVTILTVGGFPTIAPPSYFDACAHTSQFLRCLERTIALVANMGGEYATVLHYLLSKKGNALVDLGEYERAVTVYDEALQIAPTSERTVVLLSVLGRVLGMLQRFDESELRFEVSSALAATLANKQWVGFVLEQKAYVAGEVRQDHAQARALALETIELAARNRRSALVGRCLSEPGNCRVSPGAREGHGSS